MKRMTKFFMASLCAMFLFANANAQDLGAATELFNNAATALNEGKNAVALEGFEKALKMAETLGEEGATIVNDSKGIIPKILLQIGKEAANAKNLDEAIAKLKEASAKAKEYGQEEVSKEAIDLIPQIIMADANSLLNEGKFAEAAAEYQKVAELEPQNAVAYLRMGMAKGKLDDEAGAIAAYKKAAELGEKEDAEKQLVTLYLMKAQTANKAKNADETIASAKECLKFGPNPSATFFLALGHIGKKDYPAACVELKKIANDPKLKDQVGKLIPQLQCK